MQLAQLSSDDLIIEALKGWRKLAALGLLGTSLAGGGYQLGKHTAGSHEQPGVSQKAETEEINLDPVAHIQGKKFQAVGLAKVGRAGKSAAYKIARSRAMMKLQREAGGSLPDIAPGMETKMHDDDGVVGYEISGTFR